MNVADRPEAGLVEVAAVLFDRREPAGVGSGPLRLDSRLAPIAVLVVQIGMKGLAFSRCFDGIANIKNKARSTAEGIASAPKEAADADRVGLDSWSQHHKMHHACVFISASALMLRPEGMPAMRVPLPPIEARRGAASS